MTIATRRREKSRLSNPSNPTGRAFLEALEGAALNRQDAQVVIMNPGMAVAVVKLIREADIAAASRPGTDDHVSRTITLSPLALRLTKRQREILWLVADGMPSKAIAVKLAISEATLKRDMRRIFNILRVNDRASAVAQGFTQGVLSLPHPTH